MIEIKALNQCNLINSIQILESDLNLENLSKLIRLNQTGIIIPHIIYLC